MHVIVPGAPMVTVSPPHSMFEDSEAMAMLLAAALLSDAGVFMLDRLTARGSVGRKNVALYSNTAVAAVRLHFATVSKKASDKGSPLTGDAANRVPTDLNHVVLVADVSPNNHFKITTFCPVTAATAATVNVSTKPWEDLVEMDKGQFTLKAQRPEKRSISLTW